MRKLISILILIILIFNIGGYYFCFKILQYKIRCEIKNKILKNVKDQELCLIIINKDNKSDITWYENNKEFKYQGQMYDVVRIKNYNNEKCYYCINDKKEKQLLTNYYKNINLKKNIERKIKNIFNVKYVLRQCTLKNKSIIINRSFSEIVFIYKSNILDIFPPPPKNI